MNHTCSICESSLKPFYSLRTVPVNDVKLIPDKHTALTIPTGDIELAYCEQCSFIQNIKFNASLVDYDTHYEETQAYSDAFKEYDKKIIDRLCSLVELENKTVLEAGCGKGYFLHTLCSQFNIKGIGVDPTYRQSDFGELSNISFYATKIEEQYALLQQVDILICRHTLEHIPDTFNFFAKIIARLNPDKQITILIDLPASDRIINDCAYWDIYYEHCAYFSKASLEYFLHQLGCRNIIINTEYNNQYLLATCTFEKNTGSLLKHDINIELTNENIKQFVKKVEKQKKYWQNILQKHYENQHKVIIWGGGSKAVAFIASLGNDSLINAIYDINPKKQNHYLPGSGHKVLSKEELIALKPDVVIIMNAVYENEITQSLANMQLHNTKTYSLD